MPFVEAKKVSETIQQEWYDDEIINGVPNPTDNALKVIVAIIAVPLALAATFSLVYGLTQIVLSFF